MSTKSQRSYGKGYGDGEYDGFFDGYEEGYRAAQADLDEADTDPVDDMDDGETVEEEDEAAPRSFFARPLWGPLRRGRLLFDAPTS